jgi:type I restriction enzyme S subunit
MNEDTILFSELPKFKETPLGPLPEQHEIARILQTVDRKIEAEGGYKQALESLFKTLLQQLITGQIRLKDFWEV